jgi:hypothetical protein
VLTVQFGKLGTAGQRKTKTLATPEEAAAELAKLVAEKKKKGYVEAAGTGGAPAPAAPRFPFLFYGARPSDWDTGAYYDVLFAEALDAAAIAWVKDTSSAIVKRSAAVDDARWGWSPGRWAWVEVWEAVKEGEPLSADQFFETMQRVFRAVHEKHPIVEVINREVRAHSDRDVWTDWSFEQKAEPSEPPGPPSGTASGAAQAAAVPPPAVSAPASPSTELSPDEVHQLLTAADQAFGETEKGVFYEYGRVVAKLARASHPEARAYVDGYLERALARFAAYKADPSGAFSPRRQNDKQAFETVVAAFAASQPAPAVYDQLSPFVCAWRDANTTSEYAQTVVQVVQTALDAKTNTDPRWFELAAELFKPDSAASSILTQVRRLVATAPHPDKASRLLAIADRHGVVFSTALAELGDRRAIPYLLRELATRSVAEAAKALHVFGDLELRVQARTAVLAALGKVEGEFASHAAERLTSGLEVLRDADALPELDRILKDWRERKIKGAAAKEERRKVVELLEATRAVLARP